MKFCLSSGRMTLPTSPEEPGHSQSRSMPSKTPAPRAGGGAGQVALQPQVDAGGGQLGAGLGVRTASEKHLEPVQPPERDQDLEARVLGLAAS